MVTKIRKLKKGDCFVFQRAPYVVKDIYWESFGMMKIKVYILQMKFDNHDWHTRDDLTVYKISKTVYDLLEKEEKK